MNFSDYQDVDILRTELQPSDKLEVHIVRGGPLVIGLAGHLALVVKRGGKACSFGFYPYDYRNGLAMYASTFRKRPGALIWPDPIMRKFANDATSVVAKGTVGVALAQLINANLHLLQPVNDSNVLFTKDATHRLPLANQCYSMFAWPWTSAFNCATFVAQYVLSITCPLGIPKLCRSRSSPSK